MTEPARIARAIAAVQLAIVSLLLVAMIASTSRAQTPASAARTPVYVVGTLYGRHADVPAYGHAAIARIIDAVDPEVVVLDVSPDELAAREVSPGKQEYPRVIFPWLDRARVPAYAGEPAQPQFDAIVQSTIAANAAFQRDHADAAATLKRYADATYAALGASWTSTAAVNDAITGDVLAARRRLVDTLVGGADAEGWRRWNDHAASVVERAAREHPGRRVLVLTGIENRPEIVARLRGRAGIDVIPMERWLHEHVDRVTP